VEGNYEVSAFAAIFLNKARVYPEERNQAMSPDEFYGLLQLGLTLLGIVTVILTFLFIAYEKTESK
jgi:hypothetical protein